MKDVGADAQEPWRTPYPDVNAVLRLLLAEVQFALGEQFVGMYLHGSLAAGGFEPGRSDIDLVVVVAKELSGERLTALKAAHRRVQQSGLWWATRLEISYIGQVALRRYDPCNNRHPALRVDGSFGIDEHGSDWVLQRHVIRERGVVLAGPEPNTLIDVVSSGQIRWAARETLREWWAPQLTDPSRLRSDEYQAYAVLTMCRALFTLEHADVAPKAVAARWVQETFEWCPSKTGGSWPALIDRALAWHHGESLDALDEVLGLICHVVERAEGIALRA